MQQMQPHEKNFGNHRDFRFGTLFHFDASSAQPCVFPLYCDAENVNMVGREVSPMATHPSVEANLMADAKCVLEMERLAEVSTAADRAASDRAEANPAEANPAEDQLFRSGPGARDVAPIAYLPPVLAETSNTRNLRRILTREQGRALEAIGHAVDYLNDCYLYEGDEHELINVGGSCSEAIQILASMRWQILQSAPTQEPKTLRFWNALFHRNSNRNRNREAHRAGDRGSQSKPASVLPLSSSR
jgi:hypothetical protein